MKNLLTKTSFLLCIHSLVWLVGSQQLTFGQDNKDLRTLHKELSNVINLIETHNFREAINDATILYHNYPDNAEVCLILGLGYINIGNQPDSAVYFLNEGLNHLKDDEQYGETGVNLQISLGKAYQMLLQPQNSINIYDKLLSNFSSEDSALVAEIEREKEICYNSKLLLENPIALKITNLGEGVNSVYDDHSPLINVKNGTIYFTSRRKQQRLNMQRDGQYPEKICYVNSKGDSLMSPKQLTTFYRRNEHESAVSMSADGETMFLFRFDFDGKNLYSAHLDENNEWSQPQRLPEPINSYDNETHCSLSADESTMFFTSDREGGFGGLDIYMVKKDQNGNWGEAHNLGPAINTQYDEETPMIYLDGKTLYFASEGHNTMGMYDIFYSQMNADSSWNEPINMGFPINTPGDDFFFVPTIDRNRAYYATTKFSNNLGGLDLYEVEFVNNFKGELAVVEGKVEQDGKTRTIRILVSRADDQTLIGDYRPDPKTGEYTMFLETGERYQIKEVRQTIEEVVVGEIEVPEKMSFNQNNNQVVAMKSINMEPPLSPAERKIRQEVFEEKMFAQETPEKSDINNNLASIEIRKPEIKESMPNTYTIQLLALRKNRLKDYSIFKGLDIKKINEYVCSDGYYRYTYHIFDNKQTSITGKKEIIQAGKFKDAFVRPVKQVQELSQEFANM